MSDLLNLKIKEEKRRRNQAYVTLNYFLKSLSYFDFFSKDAFSLVLKSKWMAYYSGQKQITDEFFLFLFFDLNLEAALIFQKYLLNSQEFKKFLAQYELSSSFFFDIKLFILENFFTPETEEFQEISFSDELYILFDKASENARNRFKTPVITPEILLITLMEFKGSKAEQRIQLFLENETNWYLFRYQLMKKIHLDESTTRREVPINQQHFAYLLKTQLSNDQFSQLINEELLAESVSIFRNTLISLVLDKNIFDSLEEEVKKSIKLTSTRNYSS